MIRPQKPKNEAERLQVLHNLHIMDTQLEERFDRITRVVQHLFDVPIVSVSFIDKEREWYKSNKGWQFHEIPRDISFGAYAILQKDIMIVPDTLCDERFKNNPLVISAPDIRYYLGCPLQVKEQFNIGILGLMDHKLHDFNQFDLNVIKELAEIIESEFAEQRQSTIDELTQISNREGFISIGKQIIKHCNKFDKNVLLIYFDINHLNSINTHYGQEEGNKVLQVFAQQLLKNFRHTDAVARLGGDKFCVLCSGMGKEQFTKVIHRFQRKLSLIDMNHPIEFTAGSIEYNRWRHYSINLLIEETYEKIYGYKRHLH
ncbi:MAG: sensor domain-containing diguanylate cyclase [Legionella sp.]|uniref:sensor domain-containing diguanylate cyclase n=1 Tax=Legionella sp. TaxID=459 RepID=UPI0039E2D15F